MEGPHAELWQRLQEFAIDERDVRMTFAERLARKHGWRPAYARRVVEEYKRFVFLAMVADHPVTPSEEVDEAWHLHLTYTRSYWGSLCRGVLARPLHHVPTRGGPDERARFIEQYGLTLASYAKWFGRAPPPDIWPPAEERFATDSQPVRVNRRRAWVIPKPRWLRRVLGPGSLLTGAVAAPLLVGMANPLNLIGSEFLVFYVVVCVIAVLAAWALRRFFRYESPMDDDTQLSPYEAACLAWGVPGVLRTCLATLVVENRLQLSDEGFTTKRGKSAEASPKFKSYDQGHADDHDIERVMLREAGHENGATAGELLDAARPYAEEIASELQGRGLMESNDTFSSARLGPLLLLTFAWIIGASKIVVGINRDIPVVFLIIGVVALSIVMWLFWRRPLRTLRGEKRLRQLREQYQRLQSIHINSMMGASAAVFTRNDLLLAAGLFGLAALNHPDIDALNRSLKPLSTSGYDTGGCGGGCGDGCGGGCGGCGGCGD